MLFMPALHINRPAPTRGLKSSRESNHIEIVIAVDCFDPGRINRFDARRFERDIVLHQSWEIIIRDQDPAASDRIIWRQLLPERGIRNLRLHMIDRDLVISRAAFWRPFERLPEKLISLLIDDLTVHRANLHGKLWICAEQGAFFCAHSDIAARDDPVRAALENDQLSSLFSQFRNDLHGTRGAANHANPLTFHRDRMIPLG
mmetsp:Transcript_1338/g.1783  ORF Transcript_1338/g.1783 Transcript_1338/m.1783 type:complete len:202 (-) Transcript_1338:517-1122(-)